jgi:hypothetical protein
MLSITPAWLNSTCHNSRWQDLYGWVEGTAGAPGTLGGIAQRESLASHFSECNRSVIRSNVGLQRPLYPSQLFEGAAHIAHAAYGGSNKQRQLPCLVHTATFHHISPLCAYYSLDNFSARLKSIANHTITQEKTITDMQ